MGPSCPHWQRVKRGALFSATLPLAWNRLKHVYTGDIEIWEVEGLGDGRVDTAQSMSVLSVRLESTLDDRS